MKITVWSYCVLLISTLLFVPSISAAEKVTVERNVAYGMYSGLALLMDVYHPSEPNGYGVVFVSGSAWNAPLSFNATPLKESGQEKGYAIPLAEAGYTVFGINHRATPRFQYPAAVEDDPGPGGKWPISTEGGTEPQWSADGRELFYRLGEKMMVVEVQVEPAFSSGRPHLVFEGPYLTDQFATSNYDISPSDSNALIIKNRCPAGEMS